MQTLHRLDDRLLTDVNDLARHTGWLHRVMLTYASYGVVLFAVLLLAGLWLRRAATDRALAAAGWAALATLLAVTLNQPLVGAFAEARPYTTHPALLVLAHRSSDFSFPSDHAMMAGAAAAGLWLVCRALGVLATVAALVMAFSRVYIAAHYPWDVAAGLDLRSAGGARGVGALAGAADRPHRLAADQAGAAPGLPRAHIPGPAVRTDDAKNVQGMSGLVHRILELPGWLVLLVAGLVVAAEDAIFIGFVLPGETVALLAGAAAKLGHVSLAGVLIVVIAAAIVGDTVGYEIGRHLGPRALQLSIVQKRRNRVDDARAFLARRGGAAVFLGRWTAFFRAVMPFLSGAARMPYPKFLAWNALGGLTWGATVVLLGYAAGASYAQVEKTFGRDAAFVVLAIVIVGVVVWRIRTHRAERRTGSGDRR